MRTKLLPIVASALVLLPLQQQHRHISQAFVFRTWTTTPYTPQRYRRRCDLQNRRWVVKKGSPPHVPSFAPIDRYKLPELVVHHAAKYDSLYDEDYRYGDRLRKGKKKERRNNNRRYHDDDEWEEEDSSSWKRSSSSSQQYYDEDESITAERNEHESITSSSTVKVLTGANNDDNYNNRVNNAIDAIQKTVAQSLASSNTIPIDTLNHPKHHTTLSAAIQTLSQNLIERTDESRLLLLSLLAEEHILFVGPPGTAKSELGRRLTLLLPDGIFFQYLLTKFSTPEELFGPLSLAALEKDVYRRQTRGYLPCAHVAFLDEIFKANAAILNTLLTILNERTFDNGGDDDDDVRRDVTTPLRCVVGASNELPEAGDELEALFDRFLIRKVVSPVSDEGLGSLLSLSSPGASTCDGGGGAAAAVCEMSDIDEIIDELNGDADATALPTPIISLLRDARTHCRETMDEEISDRRLVKAARLLKLSAASHGRTSVDFIDTLLLRHVFWRQLDNRDSLAEFLWERCVPLTSVDVTRFESLVEGLRREVLSSVRNGGGMVVTTGSVAALRTEVATLVAVLKREWKGLLRHEELLGHAENHLWLNQNDAIAARQLLLPKAKIVTKGIEAVLERVMALEMAMEEDYDVVDDETRLSVVEGLWDDEDGWEVEFTEEEMNMSMKQARNKFDGDTFRAWKRARKKIKS